MYYVETLSAFAEIQMVQGDLNKAKESLRHTIKVRTNKLPKNDWRTVESQALLLLIDGKVTNDIEAQRQFNCKLKVVSEKLGKQHYRVQRLIQKRKAFIVSGPRSQKPCLPIN